MEFRAKFLKLALGVLAVSSIFLVGVTPSAAAYAPAGRRQET